MCWEGGGGGGGRRGLLALTAIAAVLASWGPAEVRAEVLTPPYFNLAEGRRITATATCGEDTQGPELYCKLVGANADREVSVNLIQGQFCDFCDPSDPEKRHPPEYAVDGAESWWQSPPLSRGMKYNEVNLTIDLGQEFHVAYVFIKMANSPRPAIWVLERSTDNGKTYKPWQYFADSPSECEALFGPETLQPITRDDQVFCEMEYSKIVPLEGGEIVVSFLNKRPSANDFFNSTILQEFTRATNIRLRFLRTKTLLGHLMSVARQDPSVTRRYFYSIKDISIGGRCVCNGHAENCDIADPDDQYKFLCRCKHNTCGGNCESCCPGFEQKRWRQSKHYELFQCEPCNCHGHSDQCEYDAEVDEKGLSLDIHGNYEGGGVCSNCRHNTEGNNCNRCKPKYYRPKGVPWNATDVCQPCQCNGPRYTGNCAEFTGQCECKANFTAPYCDKCNSEYYNFPVCQQCDCFINGTRGSECAAVGGQCPCSPAYAGKFCRECTQGYFGYPKCTVCDCNPVGSQSIVCHNETGKCPCRSNFGGRQCDQCADGYHNYPDCIFCKCDVSGTLPEVCDKGDGKCLCKEGYDGERCDRCKKGFHGYPNCRPCNCSEIGSSASICDISGKCPCLPNFAGRTCDQCRPGYYRFPECLGCGCDSHGSEGVSCDANGHCQCRDHFEGARCDRCKEGLYNFPICEECNCNPFGVLTTFAGCGTLPQGELCQCKSRVEGRICDECKPTYWNLQPHHRDGCEECDCHVPGVMGGINVCNTKSGQCLCKPSVGSRRCDTCRDGSYNLSEDNLFGCSDCGCDIGGSVDGVCNKDRGQCTCHPRIMGRTCNEPIKLHFFPTLYHSQYEGEDGLSPLGQNVRYRWDENEFANYSWKGYVFFTVPQNEIHYNVKIEKPSLYRMVLRYMNPGPEAETAHIAIIPESHIDPQQTFLVRLMPTNGTPAFTTVSEKKNNIPAPLVMDPGNWIVSIKYKGLYPLLLDYFVLLPAAYYEAGILVKPISEPCTIGNQSLCQQYHYPKMDGCDIVRGETALIDESGSRQPIREIYEDEKHVKAVGLSSKPAMLSSTQPELHFDLTISEPGKHILVINYVTPPEVNVSLNVMLTIGDEQSPQSGKAVLHPCPYSTACRQAVIDDQRRVAPFQLDTNYVKLILKVDGAANAAIDCVVAIPLEDWSLDYIQPKPLCVRKDGKCLSAKFPSPPDTKKIEFDSEEVVSSVRPPMIADNSSTWTYLDYSNPTVDVDGKVPGHSQYVFVVHYYQPDHPGFKLDTIIQNGEYHEGILPIRHCPSNSGCRSVIQKLDGNNRTLLSDSFILTLKQPKQPKQSSRFGVWIDYILVIPAEHFNDRILEQDNLDQTGAFISQCGQNHFYLDPTTKGFCRESVFSLTSAYNSGALQCDCDIDGSTSLECEKFGGQCTCKPNVIGRQCTMCKNGYYKFPECKPCDCPKTATCEQNTGECQCASKIKGEKCDQCETNTFNLDPYFGCEDCNCSPLGVINNNLQCDSTNGSCSCQPNIVGQHCDKCVEGYWMFPQCEICACDLRGSKEEICDQSTAQCYCKANVEGEACDVCVDGTFDIQASNVEGCSKCFCFGKTSRCGSAALFRAQIHSMDNWELATITYQPAVVVSPTSSHPDPPAQEGIVADLTDMEVVEKVTFFKAPRSYYGNMLTAYGGNLNYSIFYTTGLFGGAIFHPDVILHGTATNQYLLYFSDEQPAAALRFDASVPIIESNFVLSNGLHVTREVLMQTLQTLDEIYIRATYWEDSITSRLLNVSLDTAQEQYNPDGVAHSVEQCLCPPGYKGLSCEDCAPGYFRSQNGPYGGYCVECQCNKHSDTCDPVTGICMDCMHNTTGDHCEECATGYHGDASAGTRHDCLICACPLPITSNNFATGCLISTDSISCDCKEGYFGARCQSCAAGYYGRPEVQGDYCKPCVCNNNIDPSDSTSCDSVTGECMTCLNNTFGESCQYCAPGFYGDAILRKDCQSCICDQCGTAQCNNFSGICECLPNVAGEKCDTCAADHYGFSTCRGCSKCDCSLASDSTQCDDVTGQCRCKPGVTGRTCDRCKPGFWNYGPEGCVSCECNQGYSRGFGCNAATGQCECLPGVIGEKCDDCPYRWVLKDNEGCYECDACTHGLLNVTDELAATIDPQRTDFESAAASHFTHKRLEYINETAFDMAPLVEKLDRVDLGPLTKAVQDLTKDADQHNRNGAYKLETAEQTVPSGLAVHAALLDLEKDMVMASDKAEATVQEINNITFSLEAGSGPQTDYSIQTGERLLKGMGEQDFSDPESEAERVLTKAQDVMDVMAKFAEPVTNHTHLLNELQKQLNEFNQKLEDLRNSSDSTQKMSTEANTLTLQNKNAVVKKKLSNVEDVAKSAQDILDKAKQSLNLTASLVVGAIKDFKQIEFEAIRVVAAKNSLNDSINEQAVKLNEMDDIKSGADIHAEALAKMAEGLERQLSPARDRSQYALTAANAYVDIVNATQEALKTAQEAEQAAQNASDLLVGLGDKTLESQERSTDLLQNARGRLQEAQGTLSPKLRLSKTNVMFVTELTNSGERGIDDIERGLANIPSQSLEDRVNKAAQDSAGAQESVQDAVSAISDILTMLPEQSQMAKQVPKDFGDSHESISQAEKQMQGLPMVQTFDDSMRAIDGRQVILENNAAVAKSSIEDLKKKIAEARENTNRIKVGVRFYPNTTLQLRNPESLSQQTTSSRISVFFRTLKPNGFILYLGNEKDSNRKLRRTKTDDYLSLVIENGYPVLTVDLGSKPQRVIVYKIVSDGEWYQAIIERIGKSAHLTIREQVSGGNEMVHTNEDVISGTSSILNLDPEQSKLFIGGYPSSFKMQDDVKESWFDGEMEELVVGDTPVSLWNFVDGANNRNGSRKRSELVNLTSNTGYRFNGSGHVALDSRSYLQKERSSVQFKFQTKSPNGLLFLIGNGKQYLSVELRDGRVLYQFDLGDGPVRILSPDRVKYNDGKWHTVEAGRDRNTGLLKVDAEESAKSQSGGSNDELIPSSEMYFGGYPDTHSYRDVTNIDFDGCIDHVQIESATVDLSKNVRATGVSPGCPPKFVGQVSFSEKAAGYLRWPKVNAQDEMQLNLRFKTSSTQHQLIAYITDDDQTSTLSLAMVDGTLVLRSKNSEVTSHPIQYNDGLWHVVTATYDRNGLQLDVDDYEMFKTPNTGNPPQIQDGSIFFGGLPKGFNLSAGASASANSFVGCLADATVGRDLINFANVTDRRNVSLNKCPIGSDPTDYPVPPLDYDDVISSGEDDVEIDPRISLPTTPTPVTLPTPAPTPAGLCVLPYSPASDPDVQEESGIRLGSKPFSRYEYSSLPSQPRKKYDLSINFRTEQPNGTIFFVSDRNYVDHIALYMINGQVHYSFNCGSGSALLVSKDTYNDDKWHTVLFSRKETNGTLSIDEVLVASGVSAGNTKTLNVEPPFFLGSLSESASAGLKEKNNSMSFLSNIPGFVGCLGGFKMSKKPIVNNRTLSEGVLPCSDKVEPGFFIGAEGGYVKALEKFRVGFDIELSLEVKPRYVSGILVAVHGNKDYLLLQMVNGTIMFSVDNGLGPIMVKYEPPLPQEICNGQWLKIQAVKSKNFITLGVNDFFVPPFVGTPGSDATDTRHPMYIGGVPKPSELRGAETTEQFVGCVRNLVIIRDAKNIPVTLSASKTFGSVISNVCPTI